VNTQNDLIGKRIRAARERLGMNQSELARKANVTASYLNRTERGLFQAPSVEKLSAIATALGQRLADLTGGAEAVTEQHIASVVNDYRAAFSWAARCSCGWEELHSLAIVADRAVENHMREMEDDHD